MCLIQREAAQILAASLGCLSSTAGSSPPCDQDHPPSEKAKVKKSSKGYLKKSPGVIEAFDSESLRRKVLDEDALQPHLLGDAQGAATTELFLDPYIPTSLDPRIPKFIGPQIHRSPDPKIPSTPHANLVSERRHGRSSFFIFSTNISLSVSSMAVYLR